MRRDSTHDTVRDTFATMADAPLLACVAERQDGAFDELFSRHAPSVSRLARAVLPSSNDAEDVVQNVFLAAHRFAKSFRGDASVRTWLLTITRNESLRTRARVRRNTSLRSFDELGVEAGWGTQTPEQMAILLEQKDTLRTALDSLPVDVREIIVLRDLEGVSGQETADMLGISLAAAKSRLHRARLELKRALRQRVSQ